MNNMENLLDSLLPKAPSAEEFLTSVLNDIKEEHWSERMANEDPIRKMEEMWNKKSTNSVCIYDEEGMKLIGDAFGVKADEVRVEDDALLITSNETDHFSTLTSVPARTEFSVMSTGIYMIIRLIDGRCFRCSKNGWDTFRE